MNHKRLGGVEVKVNDEVKNWRNKFRSKKVQQNKKSVMEKKLKGSRSAASRKGNGK